MTKNRLIYFIKKIYYFLKKYKYEIITAILGATLAIISIIYSSNAMLALLISVLLIFISSILIIVFKTTEKDFYFIGMHHLKDKNDWIGAGKYDLTKAEYAYLITEASPGYIYSKCLTWSNYKYEFLFKILKHRLGVVVRAVNLSNFVMLQINPEGIRPHLLINGGWTVWEHKAAGLSFDNDLSFDKWYEFSVSCEGSELFIQIKDKKQLIFNRNWAIPRGIIEIGFEHKDQENENNKKISY